METLVISAMKVVGMVVNFIREVKLPEGSHLSGGLFDQKALASNGKIKVVNAKIKIQKCSIVLELLKF